MQSNVLEYLEETITRHSEKIAFVGEEYECTFQQIYNEGQSIGSYLRSQDILKEPVLVYMSRDPRTITAYMGVLYGGNYYVPIDSEMPSSRIDLIIEKLESRILICDSSTRELAEKLDYNGIIVEFDDINRTSIRLDHLSEIRNCMIDTDPMYVVFTSGSTGTPKGVIANHKSVIDYIEQLSVVLEVNDTTVFGNQTPLYLDACMKEVYSTLKYGCTTHIIPKKMFMFPIQLVNYMNQYKINTVCWVVSALTIISSFKVLDKMVPEHLKVVAFGSEVFPIKQFNLWKKALPDAKFINLYGPTEGTGMCTYYVVNREFEEDKVIPIGVPFKNTDIILITDDNKAADSGEMGEICIRGTSVTMGYFKDKERTNSVYTQNPLNDVYPEIIYRTGDLGKLNEHNELVFVSRKDFQIKHMGHRIELGEIEASANQLNGLENTCCIYNKVQEKIVLFYVGELASRDIAVGLKEKLPRYMIPNRIIQLDKIPLIPNGKIDRVHLTEMSLKRKREKK